MQRLWAQKDEQLFLNQLNLRHLTFDPDEAWVAQLPKLTGVDRASMPLAAAALDKLIPPALDPDAVAAEAPALLAKLKDAAQKRSETDMAPLIHPDLLTNKARVYDLFDTTNYRNHTLGRFAPMENRQVGVQFFQLTTSQVERLHYVTFSSYRGKTVVRDVVTGPEVAALFLRDEQQLALSKLNLVFRALNDGDDSGLRNLCTPGLYESLKAKSGDGGGSVLTRGQHIALDKISVKPSVSLDQKSVRVVVRVGYPTGTGKPLDYDIDFERVDKDLKVVRARDLQGGVIAWDPDIDNYLNRRYNIPDGPPPANVRESDDPNFDTIPMLRAKASRAVENRDGKKLKEAAEQLLQREPNAGEGYGFRAAMQHILGNYDEATVDAVKAIDRGGAVFFDVLQYSNSFSHGFSPLILAVSRGKIEFRPIGGGPVDEIPVAQVKATFDRPAKGVFKGSLKGIFEQPGPFLKIEINRQKNKGYKIAAVGTQCPDESTARKTVLEQYPGGGCGAEGATIQAAKSVNILVPHGWYQDLKVVLDTIEQARNSPGVQTKR